MLFFSKCSAPGGRWLRAVLSGAAVWVISAVPAKAQGFLDLLFGAPKPHPVMVMPPPRFVKPSGGAPSHQAEQPKRGPAENNTGEHSGGGTYRTVCVRMCDGFFVPMSYATTKSNFQQDQNKCRASCGDDARLFFHRNPGGAMEEAIDLNGRVYGRLPNAFKFRKTLVDGCSCRPPPWSEAELTRHRGYAAGPQSPVPGQALAAVSKPATKVAEADPAASAGPNPAKAAAEPKEAVQAERQLAKTKIATRSRDAAPDAPRVVKIAAQRPVAAPFIIKAPSSHASGNPFGLGSQSGMGLTGKPKYVWPGD
jgi:hypothetical protein